MAGYLHAITNALIDGARPDWFRGVHGFRRLIPRNRTPALVPRFKCIKICSLTHHAGFKNVLDFCNRMHDSQRSIRLSYIPLMI